MAAYVRKEDAGGNKLKFAEVDGRLYPPFPLENIQKVPNMTLRDDDVILCSYSKSGTHWTFEICRLLLNGKTDVDVVTKLEYMAEYVTQKHLDQWPSPRVVNTHFRFDRLPNDVKKKKLKIVYIRRNPKDLVVSFYNHVRKLPFYEYNGAFKDYLLLFLKGDVEYGSWFEYVRDWENVIETTDVPILDLTFEDLKKEPIQQIRRISDFLGLERNEKLIEDVANFCNFSTMKARFTDNYKGIEGGHNIFYRKGEVGDWKNWFTVAQNELFDQVYKEKMEGSKLEFKYT